jgi:hypothetical protein
MSQLLLTLLGDFRVTLDGVPLTVFQTDKMRALLIYLTLVLVRDFSKNGHAGRMKKRKKSGYPSDVTDDG